MAKILTWRDDWTLRIDTLDDDHRVIIEMLSEIAGRFGDEPRQKGREPQTEEGNAADADALYDALDRLGSFAREHFRREEEFMRAIDYPRLPEHRSEHALLLAEHKALTRELRDQGVGRLGGSELDDLKQWVVAHILGADRGFTEHYFKICGADSDSR